MEVGEQHGRVRESGQGGGGWEDEGGRWGRGTGDRAAGLGDFSNHVSAKGKNGQSQSHFRSDFRSDFRIDFRRSWATLVGDVEMVNLIVNPYGML